MRSYDKEISYKIIKKGLNNVFWPGRIQKIYKNIYFDVAHNKESIRSLISTLKNIFPKKSLFGLFCLKGDKDISYISKELLNVFDKLLICDDKDSFLLKKELLSKKLNKYNVKNIIVKSIDIGINELKTFTLNNGIGLIFGSHYIASEIFKGFQISFDRLDI